MEETMPQFAVIGLDHPPHGMKKRDAVRTAHRAYVKNNAAPIAFVGPMLDADGNQTGSLYIFEATDEQEIRDWLKDEPFFQTGVYERVIIQRFFLGYSRLQQDWPVLS
jgi:uncharacterized protein YciI